MYGSFNLWINVWVAGKTVGWDPSLTRAIPERFRDEFLMIKRYRPTNLRLLYFTDRPTERPTDHATRSVTISGIYVRSTARLPMMAMMMKTTIIGLPRNSSLHEQDVMQRACTREGRTAQSVMETAP